MLTAIKKLFKLKNLGLFSDGVPNAIYLQRATLLYGENGRGKSTLSTILRACALADAGPLNARKTLDGIGDPEVGLIAELGGVQVPIEFSNGSWNQAVPDVLVFDSEFVEENVYSGHEVRTDQRKSLLEFALGGNTVALKQNIDALTKSIEDATKRRSEAERIIGRISPLTPAIKFISIVVAEDAQAQIDAVKKRIEAAVNAAAHAARPLPTLLPTPLFDLARLYESLARTLPDVERDAERIVRAHFAGHQATPGIESWIGNGISFVLDDKCPFCGQSVEGLEIVRAYQSYFSATYKALKQDTDNLKRDVDEQFSDSRIDNLNTIVHLNSARIEGWGSYLSLSAPAFDGVAFAGALIEMRQRMTELVTKKQAAPLERVGSSSELAELARVSDRGHSALTAYNTAIAQVIAQIGVFKSNLATENVAALNARLRDLEQMLVRQRADAVAAIADYQAADVERNTLEQQKIAARQTLDAQMDATLVQYQDRINALLRKFGAGFSVEKMEPNYQGTGEPRAEYGLRLRQKSLRLGSRTDTGPHFGSTLSEGDKRTLAFAFFVAKVEGDAGALKDKVLVLDDPVCSLDRNRRAQTIEVISRLAASSSQLLTLSHDAYFIRDMRDKLSKLKPAPIPVNVLQIGRVQQDYSELSPCDIDGLCESDYYKHFRVVIEFVDGSFAGEILEAAKAIRPLIEGYYLRRFPMALPRDALLGTIIDEIRKALPGSPLSNAQSTLNDLSEINEFTRDFHHAGAQAPTDAELKVYAVAALKLIYEG